MLAHNCTSSTFCSNSHPLDGLKRKSCLSTKKTSGCLYFSATYYTLNDPKLEVEHFSENWLMFKLALF